MDDRIVECIIIEHMKTKITFTVSHKLVQERDGAGYNLANYVEGVDYVQRNIRYGTKVVFRKDILGEVVKAPVSTPALVVEQPSERRELTEFDLMQLGMTVIKPELATTVDEWRGQEAVEEASVKPVVAVVSPIKESLPIVQCKIKRVYPNHRWVETDTMGRIYAGHKGATLRQNQVIRVRGGEVYTGR
jgi:hypothetical protein